MSIPKKKCTVKAKPARKTISFKSFEQEMTFDTSHLEVTVEHERAKYKRQSFHEKNQEELENHVHTIAALLKRATEELYYLTGNLERRYDVDLQVESHVAEIAEVVG